LAEPANCWRNFRFFSSPNHLYRNCCTDRLYADSRRQCHTHYCGPYRAHGPPSGVDENNLFTIRSTGYGTSFNDRAAIAEDLDMIRSLPGVIAATVSNAVPVSTSGSSTGMTLELVAGRDFTAEDVAFRDVTIPRRDHPIIVSL